MGRVSAALFTEPLVPVLGAVELTGVVGVESCFFFAINKGVIQDRQGLVSTGIFADVFIANQDVLARPAVLNLAFELWVKIDIFGLTLGYGLFGRGMPAPGLATSLVHVCTRLARIRTR